MNNQEMLMNAVIKGDISIVDDLMEENIDVSFDGNKALRAAKIKLFEAKNYLSTAESIVSLLEIGNAGNDRFDKKEYINEEMPIYKVVQNMADGDEEAKKILSDIVKGKEDITLLKITEEIQKRVDSGEKTFSDIIQSHKYSLQKRVAYLFKMYSLGILGKDIVLAFKFSGNDIFKLFEILDNESEKLGSYLSDYNSKGDSKNG